MTVTKPTIERCVTHKRRLREQEWGSPSGLPHLVCICLGVAMGGKELTRLVAPHDAVGTTDSRQGQGGRQTAIRLCRVPVPVA